MSTLQRDSGMEAMLLPGQTGMQGSNMMVELSVEVDPMTDEPIEQSFTFTKPAVARNVADLTAEVDFEIGPGVTSKLLLPLSSWHCIPLQMCLLDCCLHSLLRTPSLVTCCKYMRNVAG